jgi:hypothetical protein
LGAIFYPENKRFCKKSFEKSIFNKILKKQKFKKFEKNVTMLEQKILKNP